MKTLISSGQTVVDFSSGTTEWLERVLACHQEIRAMLYGAFWVKLPALNTPAAGEPAATQNTVTDHPGMSLDRDTAAEGIPHVQFVRIADARQVERVLKGAARLLQYSRIDFVQFPLDTHDTVTAQTVEKLLIERQYLLYEFLVDVKSDVRLGRYTLWEPQRGKRWAFVLALHERMSPLVFPSRAPAKSQFEWAIERGIPLTGVIHVGANDGSSDVRLYESSGLGCCLMIEANPEVCQRLRKRCQGKAKFVVANNAISDRAGPVPLHVMSFDGCSSLLKPATLLEHYGQICEEKVVDVAGITLDALLAELELEPSRFNFLTVEIQGAELLALRGAVQALPHMDFLSVKVNFENVYEGCAQIEAIDDFAAEFGFRRVNTRSEHRAWATAIYAKQPNSYGGSYGNNS